MSFPAKLLDLVDPNDSPLAALRKVRDAHMRQLAKDLGMSDEEYEAWEIRQKAKDDC